WVNAMAFSADGAILAIPSAAGPVPSSALTAPPRPPLGQPLAVRQLGEGETPRHGLHHAAQPAILEKETSATCSQSTADAWGTWGLPPWFVRFEQLGQGRLFSLETFAAYRRSVSGPATFFGSRTDGECVIVTHLGRRLFMQ